MQISAEISRKRTKDVCSEKLPFSERFAAAGGQCRRQTTEKNRDIEQSGKNSRCRNYSPESVVVIVKRFQDRLHSEKNRALHSIRDTSASHIWKTIGQKGLESAADSPLEMVRAGLAFRPFDASRGR
jgi:hypothetical protein